MQVPRRVSLLLVVALLGAIAALAWGWQESRRILAEADKVLAREAGPEKCQKVRPSALATKYLQDLHGIEIGASTQNSFDLPRSINVDFSDEQGGLWQQKSCPPAIVNLVASGDDLPFKDGTLDYVVSAHVIEHFFDPVKALREWHRVIRPGGYIFIIAPHRDRTFDKHRDVTPVAELIDRSTGRIAISDYLRPLDPGSPSPQKLVRDRQARPAPGWERFREDDHHHWSAWRTADFVALVERLGYTIVETQDVDDKYGNGFTVVIRKEPAPAPKPR